MLDLRSLDEQLLRALLAGQGGGLGGRLREVQQREVGKTLARLRDGVFPPVDPDESSAECFAPHRVDRATRLLLHSAALPLLRDGESVADIGFDGVFWDFKQGPPPGGRSFPLCFQREGVAEARGRAECEVLLSPLSAAKEAVMGGQIRL